jgi:hypothetical protein
MVRKHRLFSPLLGPLYAKGCSFTKTRDKQARDKLINKNTIYLCRARLAIDSVRISSLPVGVLHVSVLSAAELVQVR